VWDDDMLLGTQGINEKGHLEIGGCDAVELARRFGTPLYVMDEADIRRRCREFRRAFETRHADCAIAFAAKAFLNLAMCRIADQEGLWMDVASDGEVRTAATAGFPAEKLYLHGNYKKEEELSHALEVGVGLIVVDSEWELEVLRRAASRLNKKARILIRVTPGVESHTHTYIETGQIDNKFGLPAATGQALRAVRAALAMPEIELVGLHCHIGSQVFVLKPFETATRIMVSLAAQIRDELGFTAREINMGGGLGVRYRSSDSPPSAEEYADAIISSARDSARRHRFPMPHLVVEPGRAVVGEAGTTLYSVGVVKVIPGARTYVSVDGGMSDNPRPALYQAVYEAIVADKADVEPSETVTIAGRHCESDILIHGIELPHIEPGDILAVQTTGAYNFTMASNYNRFPRPAVVLVADGRADIIVERQTEEDLLRGEIIPERLA
jgi:diaminopimelate decarboxylase